MSVVFTYRSGRTRSMALAHARILQQLGHGTYADATPARMPGIKVVVDRSAEIPAEPQAVTTDESSGHEVDLTEGRSAESDGLDELDADALRALADERGVKVHHRAGADKLRAALREAVE